MRTLQPVAALQVITARNVQRDIAGTANMHNQMIQLHVLSPAMQIACYQIQKYHISVCCYIKFPIKINKMLHGV